MNFKVLGIFLLFAVAAYAAPSFEEDPEALSDIVEDNNDDDLELMDEEDPAKKGKYRPMFSKGEYCVCKSSKPAGDEEEDDMAVEEDDAEEFVADEMETISANVENSVSDPKRKKKWNKKKFAAFLKKLVSPYFKPKSYGCYCTQKKAVVKLLTYLHIAHYIHLKQKKAFGKKVHYLVCQVKKFKSCKNIKPRRG